jgi:hypothetical protein
VVGLLDDNDRLGLDADVAAQRSRIEKFLSGS